MGNNIHRFARIVAIADVYDALTTQRSYKPAYKPHIAHRIMTRCSTGQFDPDLLNLFFNNVAIYPTGTVLKTTMGYAIVKKSEFGRTMTPNICIFADLDQQLVPNPFDVDLQYCPSNTVQTVVEDMELLPLCYYLDFDPAQLLSDYDASKNRTESVLDVSASASAS